MQKAGHKTNLRLSMICDRQRALTPKGAKSKWLAPASLSVRKAILQTEAAMPGALQSMCDLVARFDASGMKRVPLQNGGAWIHMHSSLNGQKHTEKCLRSQ